MTYVLAVVGLLLVGGAYLIGSRRGRSREEALKSALDERTEKLVLLEQELLRQSATDPVTGVHTQQHFQDFLEREWRRASRERQYVSVIMVEVDHFRAYAERYGKQDADACLKSIAEAMKAVIHRPSDVLARYGGAEKFGIVLGATEGKGALVLADRLRGAVEALKKPTVASPTSECMTVTIGVASATPDREAAWQDIELIASAERALARAREAGRNTVVLDTPEAIRPA